MSGSVDESGGKNNSVQISLCIPSTAISETNSFNLEQITHVAYQIAKAATLYNVSEVVILDVPSGLDSASNIGNPTKSQSSSTGESGNKKIKFDNSTDHDVQDSRNIASTSFPEDSCNSNNGMLLASLLQYFITPKYLVKSVFQNSPQIKKFQYAEKLPTLSSLPFMTNDRSSGKFKEGFTVSKKAPKIRKKNKKISAVKKLKVTKFVNIGEQSLLELAGPEVPTNVRVTVDIKHKKIVSPDEAYGKSGHASTFGYHVRLAKKVSSVFTEFSSSQGYTESIFVNADSFFNHEPTSSIPRKTNKSQGQVLVMIGNLQVLNSFFQREMIEGVEEVSDMFDSQIEVTRGLRIEDAALVGLTLLH